MKSDIFNTAINNRNRVKFLYGYNEVVLEPYYITLNNIGKKVIFGRVNNTSQVRMFEYDRIFNIKVLDFIQFSPIIPIIPLAN